MLGHAALDQRQHGPRGPSQPRRRRVPPVARQPGATRGRKRGDSARRADCSARSAAGCAGRAERHRESRWRARSVRRCRSWSLRRDRAGPPASARSRAVQGDAHAHDAGAQDNHIGIFHRRMMPREFHTTSQMLLVQSACARTPVSTRPRTPLLHHAFDTLSINRVVLQADLSTPPSRRTVPRIPAAGAAWRFSPRTLKFIPTRR